MDNKTVFFGAYFMKGSFYLDVKELKGDIIVKPIYSKKIEKVEVIKGSYKDLDDLLNSEKGVDAKTNIDNLEFDFLIIAHGTSASYYINSYEGLKKCAATYMETASNN